ncbi:MAG: hypothetical protein M1832_001392 [Thelocarpon impressellum]|nr:MAG: hypothetical protein M1832_001392 [Thelocarpon impressellum]
MGRKPNQLILEFFERGQKLEDASNRYQHTCKACGERFPKGRIDSLTTHLFKKCPAIPLKDRQRAFLQLHELPDGDGSDAFRDGGRRTNADGSPRSGIGKGQTLDLPIATRNWTALETLAEVSRQIDMSEHRGPPSRSGADEGEAVESGDAAGCPPDDEPDEPERSESQGNVDDQVRYLPAKQPAVVSIDLSVATTSSGPALPPIQYSGLMFSSPSASPHLPGLSLPQASVDPAPLPAPAISSGHGPSSLPPVLPKPGLPLEPELPNAAQDAGLSDKFFHPQGVAVRPATTWPLMKQSRSSDPAFLDGAPEHETAADGMVVTRAATFPRPIAMNPNTPQREFTSEFTTSPRSMRPKVRGRFTASRRKEVQEVRKRGACIRCRMLKKPECSGESPCSTCRNVESARLWKQPCIRTRIADELELYSAGLHTVLAYHEVAQAKSGLQFEPSSIRIRVTHHVESSVAIELGVLEGRRRAPEQVISANGDLRRTEGEGGIRLLDVEAEDVAGKLEPYVRSLAPTFFERETSPFTNATLSLASELSNQKKDLLLTRVLELWSVNHILVDLEMRWHVLERKDAEGLSGGGQSNDETSRETHRLVCAQLQSAVEKRAGQLAKMVMNELERRLLQRAQSGWFETFLVAICLLNCVERSSWLFQTWDSKEKGSKWPLDQRPPYYYHQGERFADMLHMLLKMRGLPPKTHARAGDGVLTTDGDDTARRYLDSIALSKHTLDERQNAVFDPLDSRSFELRFCAKLLAPS